MCSNDIRPNLFVKYANEGGQGTLLTTTIWTI